MVHSRGISLYGKCIRVFIHIYLSIYLSIYQSIYLSEFDCEIIHAHHQVFQRKTTRQSFNRSFVSSYLAMYVYCSRLEKQKKKIQFPSVIILKNQFPQQLIQIYMYEILCGVPCYFFSQTFFLCLATNNDYYSLISAIV